MSTLPTSEVLNRAADLIEQRGWTRGESGWGGREDDSRPLCLEGGIVAALGTTYWETNFFEFVSCPAYRAVQSYLGLSHETMCGGNLPEDPLWRWNDHRRDASEVIEVLRAVAVIEAARENAAVEVSA